jgi:glycosyltransferase involved in cell wall biosynthesis
MADLIFQRIVPEYRIGLFRNLHKELGLVVCHSQEPKGTRPKSAADLINFQSVFLKAYYAPNKVSMAIQNILKPLRKYRPQVVISECSSSYLTFWALLALRPAFGYKLIAWGHGVHDHEMDTPFDSPRGRVSLFAYRQADALLIYNQERRSIVADHLEQPGKAFCSCNTLDTSNLLQEYQDLEQEGRDNIRKRLNIKEQFNLIFIGRLLPEKQVEAILDAFIELREEFDVALHVVGTGPQSNLVQERANTTPGIYVHGPKFGREAAELLYLADLSVNPGAVGLSIVHCYCLATPVITYRGKGKGPDHHPEIEYLKDGINGKFLSPCVDALKTGLRELLSNPERMREMGQAALQTAQEDCDLKNAVNGFRLARNYVLKQVTD